MNRSILASLAALAALAPLSAAQAQSQSHAGMSAQMRHAHRTPSQGKVLQRPLSTRCFSSSQVRSCSRCAMNASTPKSAVPSGSGQAKTPASRLRAARLTA